MGVNLNPDYIQHIFGTWKPQGFHFLFYRPRIKKIVSKVIKPQEEKKLRSEEQKQTRPGVSGAGHAPTVFYRPNL